MDTLPRLSLSSDHYSERTSDKGSKRNGARSVDHIPTQIESDSDSCRNMSH